MNIWAWSPQLMATVRACSSLLCSVCLSICLSCLLVSPSIRGSILSVGLSFSFVDPFQVNSSWRSQVRIPCQEPSCSCCHSTHSRVRQSGTKILQSNASDVSHWYWVVHPSSSRSWTWYSSKFSVFSLTLSWYGYFNSAETMTCVACFLVSVSGFVHQHVHVQHVLLL